MNAFYRSLYTRSIALSFLLTLSLCVLIAHPAHGQKRQGDVVYDYNKTRSVDEAQAFIKAPISQGDGMSLTGSEIAFIEALGLEEDDVASLSFEGTDPQAYAVQTTAASNFPVEDGSYVILSSGSAGVALNPNNSGSTTGNLGGLRSPGGNQDMARIVLELNTMGASSFSFNVKFFSEEFPEFVNSSYNDGFIVEEGTSTFTVQGVNVIAPDNLVFDQNQQPITINTTGNLGMNANNAFGTTYDGATPVLGTEIPLDPEAETTTFIFSIFDVGDNAYDSAVFLDNFKIDRIDLEVAGFEVNQAVQDWNNNVPLIEGKPGIIRAFVQSQTAETGDAGGVLLKGSRGGADLGTLTATNASSFTAPANTTSAAVLRNRRADLDQSLNFPLPFSWRNGTVTLELMRPTGELDCSTDALLGADCAVTVTFTDTPNPEIEFVRIAHTSGGTTFQKSNADVVELVLRARAIMPIDFLNWSSRSYTWPAGTAYTLDNVNGALGLMSLLDCLFNGDCQGSYYGIVAPGGGSPGGGLANGVPGSVASGAMPNSGTVYGRNRHVHETAHVQGVHHAANISQGTTVINGTTYKRGPCGSVADLSGPNFPHIYSGRANLGPQGSVGGEMWGYDTNTDEVVDPRNKFELMSYCGGIGESWRWISDFTYNNIRTSLGSISRPALTSDGPMLAARGGSLATTGTGTGLVQDYLLVSGFVNFETGEVTFQPFLTVQSMVDPPAPSDGDYLLEVLDGDGNVLNEIGFMPEDLQPDAENPGESPPPVTSGLFILTVPLNGSAPETINVLQDGEILGTESASPNAPVVEVTFPNGGESLSTDPATIQWTASDADGNPLTYTVLFSADGGATFEPLVVNFDQTSLDVPLDNLAMTDEGLIKVIASDGFNSGEDISDATFITPNAEPGAFILQPGDGQTFVGNESILFEGLGNDAEDGNLTGPSLQWTSDLDGSIGSGSGFTLQANTLTLGTHTITLTVTDSNGAPGSATTTITVEEEDASTGVDEVCPTGLIISDFQATPNSQEYVDLFNAGADPIDFSDVNCVLGGFTASSYFGLIPAGVLAPGETFRFGASLAPDVDFLIPDGTLNDAFAALALLDRDGLPNGTSIPTIQPDIVTSLVYLNGGTVYGFYHMIPILAQEYCTFYDGRLHPYAQSQCSADLTGSSGARAASSGTDRGTMVAIMQAVATGDLAAVEAAAGRGSTTSAIPASYALHANYPNPFAASTEIRFDLPEDTQVRLVVFDILGREVARLVDAPMSAGAHTVVLDADRLPSGTYLYRIEAGTFTETRRMVLLK